MDKIYRISKIRAFACPSLRFLRLIMLILSILRFALAEALALVAPVSGVALVFLGEQEELACPVKALWMAPARRELVRS